MHGYSDADWAGDADDRKSTSGYLFLIAAGPVSWKSRKQSTVALSTAEAEYVALSAAVRDVRMYVDAEATLRIGESTGWSYHDLGRQPVIHCCPRSWKTTSHPLLSTILEDNQSSIAIIHHMILSQPCSFDCIFVLNDSSIYLA